MRPLKNRENLFFEFFSGKKKPQLRGSVLSCKGEAVMISRSNVSPEHYLTEHSVYGNLEK